MTPMKHSAFRLDDTTLALLEECAAETGATRTEVVRRAIRAYAVSTRGAKSPLRTVNMRYRYASEKFSKALSTLATSTAPMAERLLAASTYSLLHLVGTNHISDPALKARFDRLWARLTAEDAKKKGGHLLATIRTLNDSELRELATEIYDLALDIERRFWTGEED